MRPVLNSDQWLLCLLWRGWTKKGSIGIMFFKVIIMLHGRPCLSGPWIPSLVVLIASHDVVACGGIFVAE